MKLLLFCALALILSLPAAYADEHDPPPEPTPTAAIDHDYYQVTLPSGYTAHVVLVVSAGEALNAALLLLLLTVTIFETARRMARAGSAR